MGIMLKIQHTPKVRQPELFPVVHQGKMKSLGETRTRVGDRIERMVIDVLGLTDIPLNGSYDVCFDAGLYFKRQEIFFEVKSVRKHSKSPLYICRLEKEIKAQKQSGNPVIYVFCAHNISKVKCQADITNDILNHPVNLYLVSLSEVVELCKDLPLKKLSAGEGLNGYNRAGYQDGYKNLSMKLVREICEQSAVKNTVYMQKKKTFKIHLSKSLGVELPKRFGGK